MKNKKIIDFGPLAHLFSSEDITEIMVNSWNQIFVEHRGILVQTSLKFHDLQKFHSTLLNIIDADKIENLKQLQYDGVLPDGSRYNITFPPLTPSSATMTIRKFSKKIFTLEDLVEKDSISDKAALFLKAIINSRLTVVISGGTGTGKTSFLNTLLLEVPDEHRVISIEDTRELRSNHKNWIPMVCGRGNSDLPSARDCVVNSLRMRPDRLIIGECRGPEAYDFLSAINTGHEGSMTTVHANTASDALSRMENLITLGHAEIPLKYLRKQISTGVHFIVQLQRTSDGHRRVESILELTGMEGDIITRANIFNRTQNGKLDVTGFVPDSIEKILQSGNEISPSFFDPKFKLAKIVS